MKGIIVCSVTLREVFEVIREAFTIMSEQAKEFNDLIKEAFRYEEELEYKERNSLPPKKYCCGKYSEVSSVRS
ncbi:hypothetical protein [Bacillus thuringiensis]|uniref:hypothetical protein n=1 Tax=Bacillus thuringiensis TaxID=1428 RepID=UPI001EDEAC95|nr:hypothetical protein [Bacillus thuringiensis]